MNASKVGKLAEELTSSAFELYPYGPRVLHLDTMVKALDEMALRVFEETRERAAKIAADAIAPNRRDIADAIRAMQPDILPK